MRQAHQQNYLRNEQLSSTSLIQMRQKKRKKNCHKTPFDTDKNERGC